MTDEIRRAIEAKDFSRLENAWMEMLENRDAPLKDFLAIAQELKKAQVNDRALLLLEILAGNYEAIGDKKQALEVYKNMVFYTHELTVIRNKIIGLYREVYRKSEHIEEYLTLANLENEEQLPRALDRMDEYLAFDVGRHFYFDRYGLGAVVEVNPRKKEVVINFEKKERHFLTFDVARGLLQPVPEEHFLYKKYKLPQELRAMAESDPTGLVRFLLRSLNQPLSPSQIKSYLVGAVSEAEAGKIWEKAKKKIETDANIRIAGRTQKTYHYVEAGFDRAAEALTAFKRADPRERFRLAKEYSRKRPEVFKLIIDPLIKEANDLYPKDPALALDIYLLCRDQKIETGFDFDLETLFRTVKPQSLIAGLDDLEHQRYLIKFIKEKNPDVWPRVLKELMLTLEEFPVLNELQSELAARPEMLTDVYQSIITLPSHYFRPFPWLLKKLSEGELSEYLSTAYLPKILDGLEFVKSQKTVMKKILSLENFDRLLKKATDDDAQRILNALKASKAFAEYEKRDFYRIVEYYYPHLFARVEDVIYATAAALKAKQEEMENILNVAIPQNKQEISRAREFGDLSENAEYKAAKEKQDQLYQKLKNLEAELPKVRVIDPAKTDTSRVAVGTRVTIINRARGETTVYTILGRWDTDISRNIISNEAPTAQQLLHKAVGEKVVLNGIEYEIKNIARAVADG
jgi:transcription elongation factor GreA-like protein/transcription elongation GreA/GreB family factor